MKQKKYEYKSRDKRLSRYSGEVIEVEGTFTAINNVVRIGFCGASVLFRDVVLDNFTYDHMWVHYDDIINPEILEKNQKYKLTGSVITYYQNYQKKVVREKYTLKNVFLERI